ncbi:NmrA family protein [Catenulispora acidiphila DSM 44928]|uniref:NmrA family protein n=1 Tax=Catenulispora acidiphila (strain DSM 44928 / JCM 14897 / NBRC 102108 / NRRL B-24433 / ID139908) TaxID=479433 RepID=C7QD37_CATAD|nr:NAD(P)H-binding protein [Catenulispora acidiphila]ACU70747.1 NmrA family protein [Catenulispora acidiphila DSM 44928]
MVNIIVFGAGGRAGRPAVAEAARRGHTVTAVVRDPAKYPDLAADGVTVVAGDVTDAASVARLAPGHDVAVNTAAAMDEGHFVAAARALVEGLAVAGVGRLVAVGIGGALEVAPGVAAHDSDGIPEEARAFSRNHAAQLPLLRASDLDWVVLAPPLVFLDEGPGTGAYRLGGTQVVPGADTFAYADLALALVDEATAPTRSRELVAVA